MKTVKFCDSFEAQVIKGRLESEGISACVIHEYVGAVLPYLGGIPGGPQVQVVVGDEDYDRAMELLGADTPPQGVSVCPDCGSEELSFGPWAGKPWYKKLMMILVFPLAVLSGNPAGKLRSYYRCKKCGTEFNP